MAVDCLERKIFQLQFAVFVFIFFREAMPFASFFFSMLGIAGVHEIWREFWKLSSCQYSAALLQSPFAF